MRDKSMKPISFRMSSTLPEITPERKPKTVPISNGFFHHIGSGNTASQDNGKQVDFTKSRGLTTQAWDEQLEHAKHRPWGATLGGRGGVRLFARGLMGAGFFALASHHARGSMNRYHPGSLEEPLHWIATGVDKFAGKPIEKVVSALGHDGKAFTTFKPTKGFYGTAGGSTLGHEVVSLTFDFASMSVGDAIGRDIAGALDPNVHHNWVDRAGHISYSQVFKNIGYNTWKYLTYSAGEDWAVAIPYAFLVKLQRNAINWWSPGFGYDSDRRLNGGSFKVDDQGKPIGTFGTEGAIDLQGRFTAYNIGTLMYREAYTAVADWLEDWYKDGFKLPTTPASLGGLAHGTVNAAGTLSRWAVRDAIKATLYMTPSVPAFWMFRTPQTKYRSTFIHPEKGIIGYGRGLENLEVMRVNEITRSRNKHKPVEQQFTEHTPTNFRRTDVANQSTHITGEVANPFKRFGKPNAYNGELKIDGYENTYGWFDKMTNPLGKVNNAARKWSHKPIYWAEDKLGLNFDNEVLRGKSTMDIYVNAAFAYTPYFFMKNDVMAYNWDSAKMDMAIERAIDGATHFNTGEIKEGIGEIWSSMWNKPFKDPAREVEAQKRICDDESPPDGQNYYANARCFDTALQDITLHSKYHKDTDARRFVERLQDSRKRSSDMMDKFKEEAAGAVGQFTDLVQPRSPADIALQADPDATYADKERQRKIQSLSDFPDINTTVH